MYNTKPLFLNKSYTHGDVSNVSEIGITAVSIVIGGVGLIKDSHKLSRSMVASTIEDPKRSPLYNMNLDVKWFNETGELDWPKSNGFLQKPLRESLEKGNIIDRYIVQ